MRSVAGLVAVAVYCVALPATAAPQPTILAVAEHPDDPVLSFVRAEVGAAGLSLVVVGAPSWPPSAAQLEALARANDAIAGFSIVADSRRIEVWVVDRVTGKTVYRDVVTPMGEPRVPDEFLALRVVEILRASLMEVEAAHPSRGQVPAPPQVEALLYPVAARRVRLEAHAVTAFSSGGLSFSEYLGVGFAWRPLPHLDVGLHGLVPVTTQAVEGPEGHADVRLFLAGPVFHWMLTPPAARAGILGGGGVWGGALITHGSGGAATADVTYQGLAARSFFLAPHADAGFWIAISRRVTVHVLSSVGGAFPRPLVLFGDREAATWGRPFWLGQSSLAVALN